MKQNQKKTLIALGGIILIFAILYHTGALASLNIGSATILAISNVKVLTSPNLPDADEVWRVTASISGGGEAITGVVSSPLAKIADNEITSERPLRVNFALDEQKCSYALVQSAINQPTPNKVVGVPVTLKAGTADVSISCAFKLFTSLKTEVTHDGITTIYVPTECHADYDAVCRRNGGVPINADNPINLWGINLGNVIYRQCVDVRPDFALTHKTYIPQPPAVNTKVTVQVYNGVSYQNIQLTNSKPQATSADSSVFARIEPYGFSSMATSCPGQGAFVVMRSSSTGKYYSVPQADFGSLESKPDISSAITRAQVDSILKNYNSKIYTVLSKDYQYLSSLTMSSDGKSGTFDVDVSNNPVLVPVMVLDIDADWIGILRPTAQPEIKPLTQPCSLRQNAQGVPIDINVRNIGTSKGTIKTTLSCQGIGVTPSTYKSYEYGAGSTLTNTFSLSSTNKGTFNCEARAFSADDKYSDLYTFKCFVEEECKLSPYNNFLLDSTSCQLICPSSIQCGEGYKLDTMLCKCVPLPVIPQDCSPTGVKPDNSYWDSDLCKYLCKAGYVANQDGLCIKAPSKDETTLLIEENWIYGVLGGAVLVLGYAVLSKPKIMYRRRRR